LAVAAAIFLSVGNEARAGRTLADAVAGLREPHRLGFAVIELPLLAWVAVTLGRESELIEVIEREPFKSPWLRAGLAVTSRDFHTAADIFGEMGTHSDEAFFRLRAAEQLVAQGRRAEADEQLHPALRSTAAWGLLGTCGRGRRCWRSLRDPGWQPSSGQCHQTSRRWKALPDSCNPTL
jgi:hypothetical protein